MYNCLFIKFSEISSFVPLFSSTSPFRFSLSLVACLSLSSLLCQFAISRFSHLFIVATVIIVRSIIQLSEYRWLPRKYLFIIFLYNIRTNKEWDDQHKCRVNHMIIYAILPGMCCWWRYAIQTLKRTHTARFSRKVLWIQPHCI